MHRSQNAIDSHMKLWALWKWYQQVSLEHANQVLRNWFSSLVIFILSFRKEFWVLSNMSVGFMGMRSFLSIVGKRVVYCCYRSVSEKEVVPVSEKEEQPFLAGLTLFMVKIDGKGPYQIMAAYSLFFQ